jgi:hypothetical protein
MTFCIKEREASAKEGAPILVVLDPPIFRRSPSERSLLQVVGASPVFRPNPHWERRMNCEASRTRPSLCHRTRFDAAGVSDWARGIGS